jgi:hypothetical protein
MHCGVIYDLTKLFRCVNHELLLEIQFYGVSSILLEWFKPYLYIRKQRMELNFPSACSYSLFWKTIESGVPDELVLGPLLSAFMLMISQVQWMITIL